KIPDVVAVGIEPEPPVGDVAAYGAGGTTEAGDRDARRCDISVDTVAVASVIEKRDGSTEAGAVKVIRECAVTVKAERTSVGGIGILDSDKRISVGVA